MNAIKQCLHYDPDSKLCLSQHRLVKNFDKGFAKVEELLGKEDWRGVVKLLLTPGGGKIGDLWRKFEDAMEENVGKEEALLPLIPPKLLESAVPHADKKKLVMKSLPMPKAAKISIQRQTLVRALCKSFTHLADQSKGEEYRKQMGKWCSELLTLEGCAEDVDGLIGKSEVLLAQEEYEEAVRVLDKAFEASGRSDRTVCFIYLAPSNFASLTISPTRFTLAFQRPRNSLNNPNKRIITKSSESPATPTKKPSKRHTVKLRKSLILIRVALKRRWQLLTRRMRFSRIQNCERGSMPATTLMTLLVVWAGIRSLRVDIRLLNSLAAGSLVVDLVDSLVVVEAVGREGSSSILTAMGVDGEDTRGNANACWFWIFYCIICVPNVTLFQRTTCGLLV